MLDGLFVGFPPRIVAFERRKIGHIAVGVFLDRETIRSSILFPLTSHMRRSCSDSPLTASQVDEVFRSDSSSQSIGPSAVASPVRHRCARRVEIDRSVMAGCVGHMAAPGEAPMLGIAVFIPWAARNRRLPLLITVRRR